MLILMEERSTKSDVDFFFFYIGLFFNAGSLVIRFICYSVIVVSCIFFSSKVLSIAGITHPELRTHLHLGVFQRQALQYRKSKMKRWEWV